MNERMNKLINQCFIVTTEGKLSELNTVANVERFAELIIQECASLVYTTCQDGDVGAQAILYEFDIDNARSQK